MTQSLGVNIRVTGQADRGGRKYMEDFFTVAYQQTEDERDLEFAFFGIFDGHGGRDAALFAKKHLMDFIVSDKRFWSEDDEDVLRAISNGYIQTHYAMWRDQVNWPRTNSGFPSTSGTTASIAFIRKGKIYIGHVGDSAIVLGYEAEEREGMTWGAMRLTADHKPEDEKEKKRIKGSGGKVIYKCGVPRVVWNRPRAGHKGPVRRSTPFDEIPFLAVARSLGDLWSYNSDTDEFVVSPQPDVQVIKVDIKKHRCLIFGTDGLWNMMSPEMGVRVVQQAEKHNMEYNQSVDQPGGSNDEKWLNPSKMLVDRALFLWRDARSRADNTSAMTLMLDPPGPPRRTVFHRMDVVNHNTFNTSGAGGIPKKQPVIFESQISSQQVVSPDDGHFTQPRPNPMLGSPLGFHQPVGLQEPGPPQPGPCYQNSVSSQNMGYAQDCSSTFVETNSFDSRKENQSNFSYCEESYTSTYSMNSDLGTIGPENRRFAVLIQNHTNIAKSVFDREEASSVSSLNSQPSVNVKLEHPNEPTDSPVILMETQNPEKPLPPGNQPQEAQHELEQGTQKNNDSADSSGKKLLAPSEHETPEYRPHKSVVSSQQAHRSESCQLTCRSRQIGANSALTDSNYLKLQSSVERIVRRRHSFVLDGRESVGLKHNYGYASNRRRTRSEEKLLQSLDCSDDEIRTSDEENDRVAFPTNWFEKLTMRTEDGGSEENKAQSCTFRRSRKLLRSSGNSLRGVRHRRTSECLRNGGSFLNSNGLSRSETYLDGASSPRVLRSDTLASMPVRTLRSRNVDLKCPRLSIHPTPKLSSKRTTQLKASIGANLSPYDTGSTILSLNSPSASRLAKRHRQSICGRGPVMTTRSRVKRLSK